jgi:hypothetical protein
VVISLPDIKVRLAGLMYSRSVSFRFPPQVLLVGMTTSFPDTARLRRSDCLGSLRKMASGLFGRRLSLETGRKEAAVGGVDRYAIRLREKKEITK